MTLAGARLKRGDIVDGRYYITEVLGEGGMGTVYLAWHLATNRTCALKTLHWNRVSDPEMREMFAEEARLSALIGENPHIIKVFDAGSDRRRGVVYLVMDYVQGMTLDVYVNESSPISPALLLTLLKQLADGLGQAHRAGVVHRDLKPNNLILATDRAGRPLLVILDFGAAKRLESAIPGIVTPVGTPSYAAPEQFGFPGQPTDDDTHPEMIPDISPATDIWAIGTIVRELLTGVRLGQRPMGDMRQRRIQSKNIGRMKRGSTAVLHAYARHDRLPHGFDRWFARCRRQNPAERFQSVDECVNALIKVFEMDKAFAGRIGPVHHVVIPVMQPSPKRRNATTTSDGAYDSTAKASQNGNTASKARRLERAPLALLLLAAGVMVLVLFGGVRMAARGVPEVQPSPKYVVIVEPPKPDPQLPIPSISTLANAAPSALAKGGRDERLAVPLDIPADKRAHLHFDLPPGCGASLGNNSGNGQNIATDLDFNAETQTVVLITCEKMHRFARCIHHIKPREARTLEIKDPKTQLWDVDVDYKHPPVNCAPWLK